MQLMLLALLAFRAVEIHGEAVTLSVYYEALCPDSMWFVKYQLYPTWLLLTGQYLAIDFVPYGKATQSQFPNGTWMFECQHGPNECLGNKVQACVLSLYQNNPSLQVKFISCVMSSRRPLRAGPQCASLLGIEYDPIQDCAEGVQGDQLLAAMGNRTLYFTPQITFVPTVAVNGVYSETDQDQAMSDLTGVICRYIAGTKPAAC